MAVAPVRTPTKQAEPHVVERITERVVVEQPIVKVVQVPNDEPQEDETVLEHIPIFFQSIWTSVVRTFVPQVVALIVAVLAKVGLEVDNDVLVLAVSEAFAVVYYLAVRGLEEFKDSRYGKLLGRAARPMYFDPRKEF